MPACRGLRPAMHLRGLCALQWLSMFENLSDRFNNVFRSLSGRGRISEDNVQDAMRDVRTALLEADVHLDVVKQFTDDVVKDAVGREVTKSLKPGQEMISIVHDRLVRLMSDGASTGQTPEPPAPPPVATAAAASAPVAPAVPAAPPLVIAGDPLREALAVYFPEQVEFAYSVVMCESSGNARAVSRSGYYGLWQFDVATWQSVGGSGLPSNASVEEQMARARQLYDRRGWSPWGCA